MLGGLKVKYQAKYQSKSTILMRTLALFCFIAVSVIGCNIFSSDDSNEDPVIESINLDTQEILTDQGVWITAVVTDPDGDDVTFSWTSSSGTILTGGASDVPDHSPTTNPARWRAPSNPGEYTITCTVNDGKVTTSKSKSVTVNER
mgnify:CR=1 FL=1